MKTILIFGATGTIGTYTAVELSKIYNVIAVGRRNSDNGFFSTLGIKYYSLDITKKEDFSILADCNVDIVIHLAGLMPATMRGYSSQIYIDSILTGTLNVLNFCLDKNVDKIIFSQSHADSKYLMGKIPIPSDIEKRFPLTGDHSVYSICKNAAVDLIEHFYFQYGLKRFVLRLPTIYAYHPDPYYYVNGEKKRIAYRYIIDKAMKGESVEIWGDPKKAKEIVYIQDAIQIINNCIKANINGGVYNVGRGVAITLEEQIRGIVDVFSPDGNKSPIVYRPDMPDGNEFVHDISKTQRELGYESKYDYNELLLSYKKEMEIERFQQLWGSRIDYS